MHRACVFFMACFAILWFGSLLLLLWKSPPASSEYYYQVPNPTWRYKTRHPTPRDYAAANFLADRFFPTQRNTITSTMF